MKQTACRPESPKMYLKHQGGAREKEEKKEKKNLQPGNNYGSIVIICILHDILLYIVYNILYITIYF